MSNIWLLTSLSIKNRKEKVEEYVETTATVSQLF